MQVRIANRRAGGRAREGLSPKQAAYDSLALRTSDSTDIVVPFESGEPAQPCRGVAGGRDGRRSVRRQRWSHMLGQDPADTYARSTTRGRVSGGVSMAGD